MTRANKRSPSRETDIQQKTLTHINGLPHCWAVKFPGVLRRGVPDVIGVYHGRFIAIEVKRPGQRPTPLQLATIEQIEAAGGYAAIAWDLLDVLLVLEKVDSDISKGL